MKLKKILTSGMAATVTVLTFVSGSSSATAADFTMKFATGTQNDPQHEFMTRYEACLEPATGDRIDVQLFPGGQLGGVSRMIEGLQFGTIDATVVAGQHMKGVEKLYGVLDAPGLFKSFEQANAAYWDPEFRERYLNAGRDKGVMGLGIYAYGLASFQTIEPVEKLADFEGLKLRIIASDVERKLMDALGSAGLQVDWPEIVPALQNGQIDGLHANIVIAYASKFYTVAPHVTLTNQSMVAVVPFVSVKFLDSLPEELRQQVLDCGIKTEKEMQQVAIDFDAKAQENWKSVGAEIHKLSPDEQEELTGMTSEIADEVFGADAELKELYEILKAAAERHAD